MFTASKSVFFFNYEVGSFCFFVPSIHHIPRSYTLLRSRRAPVVGATNTHPPVPLLPLAARRSSLIRHAVAVGWTWSRSHPGVLKPCTRLASTCLATGVRQRPSPQMTRCSAVSAVYLSACTTGEVVGSIPFGLRPSPTIHS